MRPSILDPLFAAITALPGIGDKVARLYRRLLGREETPRVVDLLLHLPTGAVDRRARPVLRDVVPGSVVTVAVTVDRHRPPPPNRPRSPYLIYASDGTGDVVITYFNARKDYIDRLLPVGQRRIVSGTMAMYDGMLQMVHPDFVVAEAELANMPAIQPVYPLTEGLTAQALRRTIGAAVEKVPPLPEWLDPPLVAREKWPSFADALRTLHRPAEPARSLLARAGMVAARL